MDQQKILIEPKSFYRDFDNLLRHIQHQKSGKNFLYSILEEVQANVGERVHLGTLRLYEERGERFFLTREFAGEQSKTATGKMALDSEAVQHVLKHGSYIYDDDSTSIAPEMHKSEQYAIPAAITIRGPEQRWIAVFELQAGWVREEVIFSLNAIRNAINYRLFSDAIETDMEQAAQIQKSLLPGEVPKRPGFEFAVRSQPTELVGGDLFDFFEFGEAIFGVCIGDASGHGLPAALLVRDVVIGMRMGLEKHMKMVYTIQKLNHVIYRSTYSSSFVSLFYCEFERDGHLIYVNAGHPAPFIVDGQETEDLEATGLILGALPEIKLHRSYARMGPGSILVLYSDGLFERENQEEELFTITRLKQVVIENQDKSANEILRIIFSTVFEFGNRTKWEDDCTLVIIKRLPE